MIKTVTLFIIAGVKKSMSIFISYPTLLSKADHSSLKVIRSNDNWINIHASFQTLKGLQ